MMGPASAPPCSGEKPHTAAADASSHEEVSLHVATELLRPPSAHEAGARDKNILAARRAICTARAGRRFMAGQFRGRHRRPPRRHFAKEMAATRAPAPPFISRAREDGLPMKRAIFTMKQKPPPRQPSNFRMPSREAFFGTFQS